jgi:flavin-dependent thymidylate synthase
VDNSVELLGYYGDDTIIACSAWTSTSRELTDDKRQRVGKLIDMLWSNGHETPFEKASVHFLVNTEIASHIHLLKHRISSLNAESARYKELKEDKYYLPEDWEGICPQVMDDPTIDPSISWLEHLKEYTERGNKLYHQCVADLEPVLGRKRAKESARFFKTYNSQIQADVSFNIRSFANFVKLRRCKHAQLEIRQIADKMLKLVMDLPDNPFEHTLKTWKKNGIIKELTDEI